MALEIIVAVAAVVAGYIGWRTFVVGGFRLEADAWLAVKGDSLRITVTNGGRVEGIVDQLDVFDSSSARIELTGTGTTFDPITLKANGSKTLTINAPEDHDFTTDDVVVVGSGGKSKRVKPLPTDKSFWESSVPAGHVHV